MKRVSCWLLSWAESCFLRAYGWQKVDRDLWERPPGYLGRSGIYEAYSTGHAVNSQKWACAHARRRG